MSAVRQPVLKSICFSILQAQVTGSTLNGRKEKLQAEEGDKEKWDFLQFAEAWTPNERSEELRDEMLFTRVRLYSFLLILIPWNYDFIIYCFKWQFSVVHAIERSLHVKVEKLWKLKDDFDIRRLQEWFVFFNSNRSVLTVQLLRKTRKVEFLPSGENMGDYIWDPEGRERYIKFATKSDIHKSHTQWRYFALQCSKYITLYNSASKTNKLVEKIGKQCERQRRLAWIDKTWREITFSKIRQIYQGTLFSLQLVSNLWCDTWRSHEYYCSQNLSRLGFSIHWSWPEAVWKLWFFKFHHCFFIS